MSIYNQLSRATQNRFTREQVDEHVRAVLAKHVEKTFAEATERVLWKMQVCSTVAGLLANDDFLDDVFRKAMQSDRRRP